jgi:membrane fusion protein (multidrug efflux system)
MTMQEHTSTPASPVERPENQPSEGSGARPRGRALGANAAKADAPAHPPGAEAAKPAPRSARKPFLVLGTIALVVLAAVGGYALLTANQVTTDDAFVDADIVPVAARVSGQVRRVLVSDDQMVKAGQPLIELDDAELKARLSQAEAELDTTKAQAVAADAEVHVAEANAQGGLKSAEAVVSGTTEQVGSADAQIAAAEAGLRRAQADAKRTGLELGRAKELAARGSVTQAELENAQAADDASRAAVDQAAAQLSAAKEALRIARTRVAEARGKLHQSAPIDAQIEIAHAKADLAHARVAAAQAALDLAKLQISYTRVVLPMDGVISKISVHAGQLVQTGQALAEFVPAETYVVANFKETQLARIRPGDRAEITLDAYPGTKLSAVVETVAAATAARFSLLPADNASGNFVKVVQRVPVRIKWSSPPSVPARAGLSAEVTVHVAH